ncbi:dTDP-4-dehydrorhamnose reductase [Phaeobacter gallaeciensis]|uniref:dTDP-4-dehydrorhamnose reductase n=1 Tax=Phaeobacter gallaeciensis TaxID=60890 RepID=A0AAC9ZDF7_9RHOB|nr:dTDP-4-dehydrorhamnose reductase [Phaeobacter gallaeciensis]AHD12095.1 dTDP-4-dehydrorhamnose reductase [Phaeobacter gallaeciensis DSM 26640]ATE95279.1 dTDP-4-dehydrorhamnose reductase [Phaeobacter gallaeciensis]ATE99669.1 dTDP-4-dehydrorhamnose reductase [Phaeobacter gallaeciensis]ATF03983.1 dTDP-4-dehydrorhamnose reductase [Phaeobacter gallaeciensis]ATF08259.1 dTDP-4-dehydrorhamnose reductase [Phaeobacter gallaeciensis]
MILVFGKTGQVARELAAYEEVTCLSRNEADLTAPAACAAAIRTHAPAAVINAAAYTAVDRAEAEEELATVINGSTPGVMAETCAALGIPFVTLSTDYVFDGKGSSPWHPNEPVAPLNAYGRSKQVGEAAVRLAGGAYVILRTSWVVSAHGNNFVKTMLRLGRSRDRMRVVADQVGAPTPARAIAKACIEIAQQLKSAPEKVGTYHFSGQPETSWAEVAAEIFTEAAIPCAVAEIPSSAYPTAAPRPLNSRLDCSTLERAFGITRPDWQAGLKDILQDLGERA